ncbi:MAG: tRNA 2-thiouridine(34) synthase MnmA [Candidatus Portnoybacteria bacterium RBG_13_40_8]|uniref:tRNA-specific 2-thiouridylase MnmA n=1 Tax=Candidatus Portnoybacteria bacterium RBG_13_40_8 TaxID=1801990 RepID=A0A1G2F584_9BACT|nr:MAG: tRNA 2-thiouridine(34) synthase MnmA [Candidatus Portnoybacteria bacterium RBG_13_40_8]
MKKKKKVIVAMSGGVDSSVSAALLKKNGYDVIAVFMKFWKEPNRKNENRCCSIEAKRDAQRVAIKLGIPFYVIDAKKEFKKRVVDYLIKEYKKGNTPNPCVECNRWIKFNFLFEQLNKLKADFIATGHYARVKNGKLLIAKDIKKDQTYFLWTLKQRQLSKIIFPIGDYTKGQVRGLAKKFRLPVFEKKDSQEICFIDTCIEDFLKKYIKAKPGHIITTEGKKVGEHERLIFYTIGQRKGIKIGGIGPFYVVKKDFKNNVLIVSNSQKDLLQKEMIVKNVNWISGKPFSGKCKVKIRSMAKMVGATIKRNRIIFNKPQRAITPGQSAVFYKGNKLLGGGIIV